MKREKIKKIGIGASIPVAVIAIILLVANMGNIVTDDIVVEIVEEKEITWQPVGENDPGAGVGGFMSIFWYDYVCNPVVDLAVNATDWSTNASTHGYEDTDGTTTDTKSENASYICVRACFTQAQAMSGGAWNASRTRVTLTCSGDETISQTIQGNNSAETYGGGIESDNNSAYDKLYMVFYFDDNSDGYRVLDDGSVTWSVVIDAKY